MAVRIESNAEPIPGYRLIERLGGGGFGEVWKCEAPGGLFKAIKFVYGDLEAADEEGARAEQELKALSRVKTVRHPYILSVERFDIIEGQLLIVTELADRTLWDRFRECRSQGMPGMPRAELIACMQESAEALDLMDRLYQLQHLDIKPQNLFLVHNHVKVADFGLVKDLKGGIASVTGGVTPVYAAPETFDGKVTRFSDQYSLAIVYQELLTGQRPFNGNSLRELVMQHIYKEPDLSALPAADRPIVARALAKDPGRRYATCEEFIHALRDGAAAAAPTPLAAPAAQPGPDPEVRTAVTATDKGDDGQKTRGVPRHRQGAVPPADDPSGKAPAGPERVTPKPIRDLEMPGSPAARSSGGPSHPTPDGCTTPLPPMDRHVAVVPGGVLTPALVVGLGRLGLCVLRQLRQQVHERFGSSDALPALRLLHLDTDPETTQAACRGRAEAALHAAESILVRLQRPSHYLKPQGGGGAAQGWLPTRMLYRIPRQLTPCGVRALGRLAFVDNYRPVARRLEAELSACCRPEVLEQAGRQTGFAAHSAVPRAYVVAGLAGGTGGGMFLDVAYTLRRLLRDLGHERADIVGVLLLPSAEGESSRPAELANACAALTELGYFGEPGAVFQARYEAEAGGGPRQVVESGPPFERCLLFSLPDPRTGVPRPDGEGGPALTPATERVVGLAGQALFADVATAVGRAAEQARGRRPSAEGKEARPLYTAAGLYRVAWPRRQVLDQAARTVCRRLVQRWMSKDAKPVREALREWAQAQWDEYALSQEQLIAQLQQGCERALQQPPESVFAAATVAVQAALLPPGTKGAGPPVKLGAVVEVMERLEQLLGIPEECRKGTRAGGSEAHPPGTLEQALTATSAALREEYDQRLAETVVRLIEEPRHRLAGAEEGLRQLNEHVEQALRHHEELARELQQRAADAYQRIQEILDSPGTPGSGWKTPSSRRSAASGPELGARLVELLRAYPKFRYQSLVLQHVSALYLSLRGQLSDQLREIDFLRARLSELLGLFAPETGAAARAGGGTAGRCLLPGGCQNVEEAVRKIDDGVTGERLLVLDEQMQGLLRKQFRALVHVCMTSGGVLRTLAPAMQDVAHTFLEPALVEADVAELYLERHQLDEGSGDSATDALRQDLMALYQKAAPTLRGPTPADELFVLSAPAGSGGKEFRELTRDALSVRRMADAVSADEIVFYREYHFASLAGLEPLGPAGRAAYEKLLAQQNFTPHTRTDVPAWRPARASR